MHEKPQILSVSRRDGIMSNYIEYKDKFAFHPGYYIEEMIEESKLTLDELAYRIGITPELLSRVLQGELNVSTNLAEKLASMFGTTTTFWLKLQQAWDEVVAQI